MEAELKNIADKNIFIEYFHNFTRLF